jgi:hypothetical protein
MGIESSIRSFLTKERSILFLCILFSLLFWIINELSKSTTINRESLVQFSLPEGICFADQLVFKVNTEFTGTGWEFFNSKYKDTVNHELTFTNGSPTGVSISANRMLTVLQSEFAKNSKVKVVSVHTDDLLIRISKCMTKKVPVEVDYQATLAPEHFFIGTPSIIPDSITISGSLDAINDISHLKTETINSENQTKGISISSKVLNPHPNLISISSESIQFSNQVEKFTLKEEQLDIKALNTSKDLVFIPKVVSVTYLLPVSLFDTFVNTIEIYADMADSTIMTEKKIILQARNVPSNIKNLNYSPKVAEFFTHEK